MRHEHPFLDGGAIELVPPDGNAAIQAKLRQRPPPQLRRQHRALAARVFRRFQQRVEHHHAAEGVGQRRDEQSVVAARHDAGHGGRAVAADPVRDDPFVLDQGLQISGRQPAHR